MNGPQVSSNRWEGKVKPKYALKTRMHKGVQGMGNASCYPRFCKHASVQCCSLMKPRRDRSKREVEHTHFESVAAVGDGFVKHAEQMRAREREMGHSCLAWAKLGSGVFIWNIMREWDNLCYTEGKEWGGKSKGKSCPSQILPVTDHTVSYGKLYGVQRKRCK